MKEPKSIESLIAKLEKTAEKLKLYREQLLSAAAENKEELEKSEVEISKSGGQWRLTDYKRPADWDAEKPNRSVQGRMVDLGETERAKKEVIRRLRDMKSQPKPKLPETKKSDGMGGLKPHDVHVNFKHNGQDYNHTFSGVSAAGGSHAVNTALEHLRNKLPGATVSSIKAVPVNPEKVTATSYGNKIK